MKPDGWLLLWVKKSKEKKDENGCSRDKTSGATIYMDVFPLSLGAAKAEEKYDR
jgi:hypothetical protein